MLKDKYFIKPCPFCGNPANFVIEVIGEGSYRGYHGISDENGNIIKQVSNPKGPRLPHAYINCNVCYAKGPYIRTGKEHDLELIAIKQWNERNIVGECKEFEKRF